MNQIAFQDALQTSTAQGSVRLGQEAMTADGRRWVYVKADSALAKGSVAVPNAVASADTVSSSADSQGRIIYITKASAGWTAGAYAGGWVIVDDGTGVGQHAKIQDNTADTLILEPAYALTTALAVADSDITIVTPFLVDKAAITSTVQQAVGIAQVAFAASEYGWLLKEGDGVVLAGEALVIGTGFVTGDDTTGQVVKATTAKGSYDEQTLGFCRVANASADQLTLVHVAIP
jgi:hypothetical protein